MGDERGDDAANVPEAKADLLHAIYERIVVAGGSFVSARLTPAAYAHGLALVLPEKVAMARPTGVGRGYAHSEVRRSHEHDGSRDTFGGALAATVLDPLRELMP